MGLTFAKANCLHQCTFMQDIKRFQIINGGLILPLFNLPSSMCEIIPLIPKPCSKQDSATVPLHMARLSEGCLGWDVCLLPRISLTPDDLSHEATVPHSVAKRTRSCIQRTYAAPSKFHRLFNNVEWGGAVWCGAVRRESVDVVHFIHSFIRSCLPKTRTLIYDPPHTHFSLELHAILPRT